MKTKTCLHPIHASDEMGFTHIYIKNEVSTPDGSNKNNHNHRPSGVDYTSHIYALVVHELS